MAIPGIPISGGGAGATGTTGTATTGGGATATGTTGTGMGIVTGGGFLTGSLMLEP